MDTVTLNSISLLARSFEALGRNQEALELRAMVRESVGTHFALQILASMESLLTIGHFYCRH